MTTTTDITYEALESIPELLAVAADGNPVGHVIYSPDLDAWLAVPPGEHPNEAEAAAALLPPTDLQLTYEPLNGDSDGLTLEVSRDGTVIGNVFYDAQEDAWWALDLDEIHLDESVSYTTRSGAGRAVAQSAD